MTTESEDRRFEVPQGSFDLQRFPAPEPNLLAWDGADTLLLEWLAEREQPLVGPICVVNDRFGALALALAAERPQVWSDSFITRQGISANAGRNGLSEDAITFVPSSSEPEGPLATVLIKVPKSLAELEDQLSRLRPLLAPGATVVAGGMTKHIHNSTIELFDRYIGAATTSLAKRKARLIFASVDESTLDTPPPEPALFETREGLEVVGLGPVFSRESIDIGTSLLLDAIPKFPAGETIVDLGCGNGVVGLSVLARSPETSVVFTDESYLAIESARASVTRNSIDETRVSFVVDDCGAGIPSGSADVVLLNPPFHDRGARSDEIARRMLVEAKRILKTGGSIYVVGNRHLGYHNHLKRRFGHSENVKSNSKFTVLRATKR